MLSISTNPGLALLYALIGLAVGSFLNVVIERIPTRQSLLAPPSHCPACGRRLTTWELVPVLSYLVLHGCCRSCGAPIPRRMLAVELASGLLFALLWLHEGLSVRLVFDTIYAAILLVILVIDLERMLVPNRIILPTIGLALLALPLQSLLVPPTFAHTGFWQLLGVTEPGRVFDILSILSALTGGLSAFLIFWLIYLLAPQGMGAGDVKLAAFVGLVTAFPLALAAVFGAFILGGVVAVVLLAAGAAGRKTRLPFAPFLVITTWLVMFYGDPLLHWYLHR